MTTAKPRWGYRAAYWASAGNYKISEQTKSELKEALVARTRRRPVSLSGEALATFYKHFEQIVNEFRADLRHKESIPTDASVRAALKEIIADSGGLREKLSALDSRTRQLASGYTASVRAQAAKAGEKIVIPDTVKEAIGALDNLRSEFRIALIQHKNVRLKGGRRRVSFPHWELAEKLARTLRSLGIAPTKARGGTFEVCLALALRQGSDQQSQDSVHRLALRTSHLPEFVSPPE